MAPKWVKFFLALVHLLIGQQDKKSLSVAPSCCPREHTKPVHLHNACVTKGPRPSLESSSYMYTHGGAPAPYSTFSRARSLIMTLDQGPRIGASSLHIREKEAKKRQKSHFVRLLYVAGALGGHKSRPKCPLLGSTEANEAENTSKPAPEGSLPLSRGATTPPNGP
jgi:hypothetical protein